MPSPYKNCVQALIPSFRNSLEDLFDYSIDWGDGTISQGSPSAGSLTDSHSYAEAGEYPVSVTLEDDDTGEAVWNGSVMVESPTVSLVASDPNASEAGTDSGAFTISRNGDTTSSLTVDYSIGGTAINGTDYNESNMLSGSVTIGVGASSTTVDVVPILDGDSAEGTETVVLTLTSNPEYEIDASSDSATVTIADGPPPTVNITTDSNNDGFIDGSDDLIEESIPGRLIPFNGDDDNGDSTPDRQEMTLVSGENDLAEAQMSIDVLPGVELDGFTLTLEASSGGSYVKLWDSPEKDNEIPLGTSYAIGSGTPDSYFPNTIYVEGYNPGISMLDMVLFNQAGTEVARDKVRATSVKVESIEYLPTGQGTTGMLSNDNPDGANGTSDFQGGYRFFPGATPILGGDDPIGLNSNNIVRIRAKITPVIENVTIWFRSYDVDDPSESRMIDSNDWEVDSEDWDLDGDTQEINPVRFYFYKDDDNVGTLVGADFPTMPGPSDGLGYDGRLAPVSDLSDPDVNP